MEGWGLMIKVPFFFPVPDEQSAQIRNKSLGRKSPRQLFIEFVVALGRILIRRGQREDESMK